VLLKLISSRKNSTDEYQEEYLRHPPAGITVQTMRPYPQMGCPGTAQVARLFACLEDDISPKDVIITADADAFPISANLLEPLQHVDKTAWIWQHIYSERSGHTFPMSFIALRSKDWKHILCGKESSNTCVSSLLDQSPRAIVHDWGFDQYLVTKALLQSNICAIVNPKVWAELKLSYTRFDDSATCFHGNESNSHSEMQLKGKSWLHASPSTQIDDVVKVLRGVFGLEWPEIASETWPSEASGPVHVALPSLS